MWSSITPAATAFTVSVAQASITALGTEFDLITDPNKNDATLTVLDGSTKIVGKGGERVISSGNRVRIANGAPGEVEVANLITTTNWVNELLMMTGEGCGRQVVKRHRGEAEVLAWPAAALGDIDVPEDYARVQIVGGAVEPLGVGGASLLTSTTRGDGFVIIPADSEGFAAGAEVEVWLYA